MRPPIALYQLPRRLRTDYRIGLSAWTDKSMIEDGQFYPRKTMTPEERLWWYSRYFDVVEVNSSFYAIPSPEMTETWVARTPPGFLFNMKAFGLLTGHHVDAARLPDELRKLLPAEHRHKKAGRIPATAITDEARAWSFDAMQTALTPLRQAHKLGYVLFQLAPWLKVGAEELEYLAGIPRALPKTVVAVEFRNRSWFGPHTDETLKLLAEHGLAYVSIDGPRTRGAVPSLPALTAPTGVFRLHGRNFKGWLEQVQGKAPTVAEKYDYLYKSKELLPGAERDPVEGNAARGLAPTGSGGTGGGIRGAARGDEVPEATAEAGGVERGWCPGRHFLRRPLPPDRREATRRSSFHTS